MLTLIFWIFMILIFGNILMFSIKMAWGVSKVVCSLILLPVFLIVLVLGGLIKIAFPVLAVVGLISLLTMKYD